MAQNAEDSIEHGRGGVWDEQPVDCSDWAQSACKDRVEPAQLSAMEPNREKRG